MVRISVDYFLKEYLYYGNIIFIEATSNEEGAKICDVLQEKYNEYLKKYVKGFEYSLINDYHLLKYNTINNYTVSKTRPIYIGNNGDYFINGVPKDCRVFKTDL